MKRVTTAACGLAAMALPAAAAAHTFGAGGAGLLDGLAHPFAGIDHLLAMLAVGWWAAQGDRRRLLLAPAAFVAAMIAGAVLALAGVALPHVEAGIAVSLLGLGLMVALAIRLPIAAGAAVIAVFAVFHGHAHGGEMPAAAAPVLYGLGLVVATGALHAAGIASDFVLRRPWLTRAAGAATAATGLVLAAG